MKRKLFAVFSVLVLLVAALPAFAGAAPTIPDEFLRRAPTLTIPAIRWVIQQAALQAKGFEAKMNGKTSGPVAEVAKGQFVQLEREGEDSIWTVIGEFGPLDHPAPILFLEFPVRYTMKSLNRIAAVDNTTIWAPDFTEAYYEDLLFSEAPGAVSMRNFYIEQSSNRYTVNGDVTDWVQVPYNAAAYGRNYCGSIVCAQTWVFVNHSIDAWYNAQIAAGKTAAEINAYLGSVRCLGSLRYGWRWQLQ